MFPSFIARFACSLTAAAHAAGPQVRSCSYTSGDQVLRAHATQRLPIAKLEFTAAQPVAAGRCDRYIGSDHTAPLSLWLKASGSWARAELRVAELLAKRSLVSHGAQDRAIRLLVGFGRIVASEIQIPNMFVNMA